MVPAARGCNPMDGCHEVSSWLRAHTTNNHHWKAVQELAKLALPSWHHEIHTPRVAEFVTNERAPLTPPHETREYGSKAMSGTAQISSTYHAFQTAGGGGGVLALAHLGHQAARAREPLGLACLIRAHGSSSDASQVQTQQLICRVLLLPSSPRWGYFNAV